MKSICSAMIIGLIANGAYAQGNFDDLLSMSFKDLNKVKVTSVSRKEESSFGAPAAIYVITADDIRRSGATNVADVLRVVPGLDVAQQNSATWAISSRGFNEQFSNKLLVLMDGRTIYTPLFSGVFWDEQGTLLEDIDRIEVIRGPGATLWGANAVNGVINIITKNAKNTQGGYAEAFAGNYENGSGGVRYGGKIKDGLYYRVYTKYKNIDSSETAPNDNRAAGLSANDSWYQSRTGFRADWDKDRIDQVSIHGDVYDSQEKQDFFLSGTEGVTAGDQHFRGGNLVGRWDHKFSDISDISVQAYIDYTQRNISVLDQQRTTFDIDVQNSIDVNARNQVVWGLGFRYFTDTLDENVIDGIKYFNYTPDKSDNNLYSGFVQDKIAVVPDKLFLTLGSKIEHNYYTGWEPQPNARISWLPDERQTLWGAVSRAARTPTRGENGLRLTLIPDALYQEGSTDYESEYLTAYEVGYRVQPNWRTQIDTTVFYNDYTDLQTFELKDETTIQARNNAKGESYGFELTSRYSINRDWNLYASYALMTLNVHLNDGVSEPVVIAKKNETKSAKNKFNIMSRLNLPYHVELDNSLYYVDNISGLNIPSYIRFDTRVGWKPLNNLELSVVGQNLLDDHHPEFEGTIFSLPTELGRSIYGKVSYRF